MPTTQTQTNPITPRENLPVIDEVYDPVTGRRDGKILPCAPVQFTGRNLLCLAHNNHVCFHVSPVSEPGRLIPVGELYRYENTKILVQMPWLAEGQYRLVAGMSHGEGRDQESIYPFPGILEVKEMTIPEIIIQRQRQK